MDKALLTCLCIIMLIGTDIIGLTSFSSEAQAPAGRIIIEDADYVANKTTEYSADLINIAENVTPRTVVEYGDFISKLGLYESDDLSQVASIVSSRIIVEYVDSIFEHILESVTVPDITPRITVEYADSIFSTDLERPMFGAEVSARIDSYSISPRDVTVGEDVTIGFSFTNTGNVSWTFGAGATLRKPDGTRIDFLKPVTVNPGESGSAQWTYTIDVAGRWDTVFGVWKESTQPLENLLVQTGWVPEYITATAIENQPPTCVIKLQKDGVEIDEIDVGEFFDIYVGDSTDNTGIKQVRFSSDDIQGGNPTGEWTEWYDWDNSLGDWNASTKIKRWAFATGGDKEVWAEVKDDIGQTGQSYFNISVVTPVLQKTVSIFTRPYVPIAEMTVTYNWIDKINGEDIYMLSKIQVITKGFTGVCKPRIFDQQGRTIWSDSLIIWLGKPYVKDYTFEGISVCGSDAMGISISGVDIITALVRGTIHVADWWLKLVPKLGEYLDMDDILELAGVETWEEYPIAFAKSSSTQFYPESAEVPDTLLETPDIYLAYLCSPGELRVYDVQGRVTGLVNGKVKEDIPNSTYSNNTVMVLSPSDSYRYEVAGTKDASYKLTVASVMQAESNTFIATDIPTSANAIHQYIIDWFALSQDEEGVTVKVDSDGDGVFELTFTSDSELTQDEFMLQLPPGEAFPMWMVGAAVATIAIATAAIAVFWRRRKHLPAKN